MTDNSSKTLGRLIKYVRGLACVLNEQTEHGHLFDVGSEVKRLASAINWEAERFPIPKIGTSFVEDVFVSPSKGPSIYLVSDTPGVFDPPHEHLSWTIIVGLKGVENHSFFQVVDPVKRLVEKTSQRSVKALDILVLDANEIHAVGVSGDESTFHLHLYGSPIKSRAPFRERCFDIYHDDDRHAEVGGGLPNHCPDGHRLAQVRL